MELDIKQTPRFSQNYEEFDLKKFNLDELENCPHITGNSYLEQNRTPIFPFKSENPGVYGFNYIGEIKFKLFTLILEDSGYTKQLFNIQKIENETPNIIEIIEKRVFKPFITI